MKRQKEQRPNSPNQSRQPQCPQRPHKESIFFKTKWQIIFHLWSMNDPLQLYTTSTLFCGEIWHSVPSLATSQNSKATLKACATVSVTAWAWKNTTGQEQVSQTGRRGIVVSAHYTLKNNIQIQHKSIFLGCFNSSRQWIGNFLEHHS